MTKKRSTKRALLLSTLSLLLCISMLIGSTFAWFTDEVKSGTNIIAAGNLDVELYYSKTKDFSDEKKVDGQTVLFTDKDGKEIKYWEPGVVAYTNLQVANVGSLALTYRLTVNSIATNYVEYADGSKYDLTDVLKVAVVKDGFEGDRADAKGLTFEAIESFTLSGELEAEKKSEVYGVVIYWEPNNNDFDNLFNMNNGKTTINGEPLSIELGITLSATQEEFEKDSFDETYDEEASYLVNKGEIVTFKPEDDSTELEMNGQVENNGVLSLVQTSMKNDGLVIENNGVANLTNVKAEVIPGEYWGGYFIHGVGKDSYTVFENVNATTLGGGVQLDDAAQAIFKSGSITTNSVATSGRHVFYLLDGSQITIEDGDFKLNPTNLSRKGYYVCATYGSEVIIKGGNFDKPSNRSDYKAGFYADATSSITVYGGTFKFDPTPWVATGCEAVKSGDTWTVQAMSAADANTAFEKELTADKENIVVNLGTDVTYDVAAWANDAMGGASTKSIVINANGHTITFNQTNSDWNNIVTNSGAKLVINDAKITNAGNNNGPWNRHDLNFACEVELNNVVSDKAMAFKAGATLNNVKINDANTSDTYAIWIQPNGQTVTLDGCTIDMLDCTDGRGIKIDEQYVSAAQKVTLVVKNTTFKTEEKSAILVKSVAGADITLENVDISGVAADSTNAVWVDEAGTAYADLVTVTGGNKILEP